MGIFVTYDNARFDNVSSTPTTLITTTTHPLIINGLVVKNLTSQTIRFNLRQTGSVTPTLVDLITEFPLDPYETLDVVFRFGLKIFLQYSAAVFPLPEITDSLIGYTKTPTQLCDCFLTYTSLNDLP